MRALKRFFTRLINSILRRRDEERLREEVQEHLALQTAENLRAGLSPGEARRQAVLKFGAVEAIKEDYRDQRGLPFLETLLQDIRYGLRQLCKNPGLTLTVLLTLALGIGANTAIFTVDYATLLAPLPYPQPDQLVMVWSKIQTFHNGVSAGDFTDWKQQNSVFSDLNAWSGQSFNIATKDQPEYLQANATTPGMLQMVGERLFLGRYFLPEEGVEGKNHVVILTHKLWVKLGSNKNIIGTTMRLDGQPYTVVGVQ